MEQLSNLDFSDLAQLIKFFEDLLDVSDAAEVFFDDRRIVGIFAANGFAPGVTDPEVNTRTREGAARYIIGQALRDLQGGGSIIPTIYERMAREWRVKFSVGKK